MNILIITADLNERSGRGTYPRAVVKELLAHGQYIGVCSEGDAHVAYQVVRMRPLAGLSLVSFVLNAREIRAAARRYDIVHALDGWPFGVYGYLAVLGTRKRLYINCVGTYSVAPLYTFFVGWFLRRAYARTEKIFCISEYTRERLVAAHVAPEKVLTVLMGTTALPENSGAEQTGYAHKYGIAGQYPIILTVGEIKERKGQLDTLKAVEILKGSYPEILYLAVGTASSWYAKQLVEYASGHGLQRNLLVVTDADDRALSFFYSRCDVFALNSTTDEVHHHFEGFGLVIVEAYQFGKPAVGSAACGIEDAIADGKTGLLSKQYDADDIADKLKRVLERYDFFSQNAKMRHADFNWRKTVDTYIQEYSQKRA
jgi:glycosyltransferase involved in cell wall biosynthesis